MRDDDRDGLLSIGRSVHADVGHKAAGLVDGLEPLEGDILGGKSDISVPVHETCDYRLNTYLSSL